MKRLLLFILIGMTMVLATGCWDRREINDVALVVALGLDKIKDKYLVTLQLPIVTGGKEEKGGQRAYVLDSSLGRNIGEAIHHMQKRNSRTFKLSHMRVVFIGEELAKNGINEILDFLNRNGEVRLSTLMFVTEGKAVDSLNTHPKLDSISSESIREIANMFKYGVSIRQFLSDYYKEGKDPIVPLVHITERDIPEITTMALFEDDKMKLKTNAAQSLGISWLKKTTRGSVITFRNHIGKFNTVRITEQNVKITPNVQVNNPSFHIDILAKGFLLEYGDYSSLKNTEEVHQLEEDIANEIKREVKSFIKTSLAANVDPIGFGNYLHGFQNVTWEEKWKHQWPQLLPTIKTTVRAQFVLTQTGLNFNNAGNKEAVKERGG